ncbi:MAG: hypothetical protein IJ867_01305 [Clostridia bacterium]|nr:hypothetical protein [Clostridia bacterium]
MRKKRWLRAILRILLILQLLITMLFFIALMTDIASGNMENLEGGIIVNVLAFGILIPLCIGYFKTNRFIKKVEKYQNLILIREIYDTQKLSDYLSCSRAEVLEFVSFMIKEGYLNLAMENDNLVKTKEYVDPEGVFSVICQICGANNKYIQGKVNKCEYCGTVLKLK